MNRPRARPVEALALVLILLLFAFAEGTSATLSISLGHGCSMSGESYSTRYVTALFPNGANPNLSGVAYTTDGVTNYSGNAMFGIKPEVDCKGVSKRSS